MEGSRIEFGSERRTEWDLSVCNNVLGEIGEISTANFNRAFDIATRKSSMTPSQYTLSAYQMLGCI